MAEVDRGPAPVDLEKELTCSVSAVLGWVVLRAERSGGGDSSEIGGQNTKAQKMRLLVVLSAGAKFRSSTEALGAFVSAQVLLFTSLVRIRESWNTANRPVHRYAPTFFTNRSRFSTACTLSAAPA